MTDTRTKILDHKSIEQKLKRIAFQLFEYNHEEKEIVFVSIQKQGVLLASRLAPMLEEVSGLKVHQLEMKINKKSPLKEPSLEGDHEVLSGKSVVLIDDVLNSGRTLIYATRYILGFPIAKLTTVVLVDRMHRKFPIKADFVGLTLSTTLQDHIRVDFKPGNDSAYLE